VAVGIVRLAVGLPYLLPNLSKVVVMVSFEPSDQFVVTTSTLVPSELVLLEVYDD